jgi:hypothetical protein
MAHVGVNSINSHPKQFFDYILDQSKNPDLRYTTGINCVENAEYAYMVFKENFEYYARESFNKKSKTTPSGKVTNIKMFHYHQSFSPTDNITPQLAHKIGVEFAEKMWGKKNRQIIISTHIDKGHLHNHFGVAAIGLDGKKWHDNKTTLKKVRECSDSLCREYGLSVIENRSAKGQLYHEWQESKKGKSWKDNLRDKIDRLIADSKVTKIDELMDKLESDGCKVRRGKFVSVKPPEAERAVRLFRLGNGYSEEQLAYRLQHKDKETSYASIFNRYQGISVEYALVIRQIELSVYKKRPNPKRFNYKNLMDGAELLNFISAKNITSFEQFERIAKEETAKKESLKTALETLKAEQRRMKKVYSDGERYFSLFGKPERTDDENREMKTLRYIGEENITSREKLAEYAAKMDKLNERVEQAESSYKEQTAEDKKVNALFERYKSNLTDDYTKIFEQVREERREGERLWQEMLKERYGKENDNFNDCSR